MPGFDLQDLAKAFEEHRSRLLALAKKRVNPILLRRLSCEDVVQDAYAAAAKRLPYFAANPDVPVYFKFRTILLQTVADLERRHLMAEGRDAYKEVDVAGRAEDDMPGSPGIEQFAAALTSPASRVDRDERHALLCNAIASLPENDRRIVTLRHFDGLGNAEAAAVLGIEPKAASIRHVRALERLQKKLMELSCFRKK